jgi:K+-transporting ATPase ATPase C chain
MASINSTGTDRGGLAKGAPGMLAHLRAALVSLVLLTVVTGIAYPVIVTAIAALVFPRQAAGSLVVRDGKTIGSTLIGQPFDDPKYFWGRPSATSPFGYNAAASSGSNLSPTNPALVEAVRGRVEALRAADPGNTASVPVDLVTASGSGLDPHVSPAAAFYQVRRVAKARGLTEEKVRALVEQNAEGRQLGFLGEPRVNVLALNLALDGR